jgi:hypothetical protein
LNTGKKLTISAFALAALLFPATGSARAAAPAAPVVPSAAAADTPTCEFGACYDYVYGNQAVDDTGASVTALISDPQLNENFGTEHSLQELAVQNSNQTSTVEVGWTVDHGVNGDYQPHLFVYHWVNGQTSCYNGCGFVQTSGTVTPGETLTTGGTITFGLELVGGDWQVLVNGAEVGYFPGSLWSGTFTQGQLVSVFGEVAMDSSDVPSCTQMGNGQFGTSSTSSWFSGYQLQGASSSPDLSIASTSPGNYDQGSVTATGYHLGGPGSGTTCTT